MKLRWKVDVKTFGGDVYLRAKPVLQYEDDASRSWKDVPVVEVEEEEEDED